MSVDWDSAETLIQRFHLLQEERAHTYRLFQEGHKIYLNSAPDYNFLKFRQLVNDVTQDFKRISQAIIAIEKQLRFGGYPELADIVATLQDYEKRRLELSANLQMAEQEAIDSHDMPQKRNEVIAIKQELRRVTELVNDQISEIKHLCEEGL